LLEYYVRSRGSVVKEAREAQGITIWRVADEVGITVMELTKLENGYAPLEGDNLVNLSGILNLDSNLVMNYRRCLNEELSKDDVHKLIYAFDDTFFQMLREFLVLSASLEPTPRQTADIFSKLIFYLLNTLELVDDED